MHTIVHSLDSQFLTPFFHFKFESSFHNHLFGLFEKLKICVQVFLCTWNYVCMYAAILRIIKLCMCMRVSNPRTLVVFMNANNLHFTLNTFLSSLIVTKTRWLVVKTYIGNLLLCSEKLNGTFRIQKNIVYKLQSI